MTYPVSNQVYPVANAVAKTRVFITIFSLRNPTTADINYEPTQRWFNTLLNQEWILVDFTEQNEIVTANWHPIASSVSIITLTGNTGGPVSPDGANNINVIGDLASGINVVGNPPTNTLTIFNVNGLPVVGFTVDAFTGPGTNPVLPDAMGLVTITGGQVAAGTTSNVIRTDSLAANTYTIEIQRSQAVASPTVGDNGVCHFNSAQFTVDADGFVSISNAATIEIVVDASTPPGTNPVVPDAMGQFTITGGQIAAGSTTNVIRTDSLAANTFTIEIQRSQAVASSTIGDNGVCHFNSAQFTVDANGFVSITGGSTVFSIVVDAFTAPGTNPVLPNMSGEITITGGQVAAGTTTNVIRTDSLAANTFTIEIQRSQAVASSTVGDNGVSHFDSANFTVDSNGFVSLLSQAFNYTDVVGPTTYVVLSTDYYISCDPSGGAITLQFPNAPTFKRLWVVKDRTGSAAVNNITLTTPGGTVTFDGLTSYIMNSNYEALNLLANSTPTYEVY